MRNTKFGRKWTLKKLQRKGGQKEASGGRFWRLLEANLGVQERKYRSKRHAKKKTNFEVTTDRARIPQNPPGYLRKAAVADPLELSLTIKTNSPQHALHHCKAVGGGSMTAGAVSATVLSIETASTSKEGLILTQGGGDKQ